MKFKDWKRNLREQEFNIPDIYEKLSPTPTKKGEERTCAGKAFGQKEDAFLPAIHTPSSFFHSYHFQSHKQTTGQLIGWWSTRFLFYRYRRNRNLFAGK